MSSNEQRQFLNDILNEIDRHKEVYRLVEFKSVLAKTREKEWYNFATLITMMQSGTQKSWEKQLEKDNLLILSAVVTIDKFKEILQHLVNDYVLEEDGYTVHGPFNLCQKDFRDSELSKRSFDIGWAANAWRLTGKENFGLPDSRSLELESEDLPFSDTKDAISYYTSMSLKSDSSLENAIHIVAPLYYAKIRKAELSGLELFVETDFNLVGAQDVRLKYNTEGPDERSSYYKTIEAGTVKPSDNATTIHLKEDAQIATVWLYHSTGFKIDSRRVTRKPSIEDMEKRFFQENPYLWDVDINIITETILSHSKTGMPELVTTELGVDSIDVEILKAVKTHGGDYTEFIPEVLKYISLNILLSRLARLRVRGFLILQPPRKILLTSLGVDTINLPPSVLSAKVPPEIDKRISEIRSAFKEEDYDGVTNKSTKLLETLLRERLESKFSGSLVDVWPNLKLEPYERASLGTLKEGCVRLNIFRENGVVSHLVSTILQLRVPMSHEKGEIKSPSQIAILTVELIEAFVRNWYFLEL